jgi:hypothetical protein
MKTQTKIPNPRILEVEIRKFLEMIYSCQQNISEFTFDAFHCTVQSPAAKYVAQWEDLCEFSQRFTSPRSEKFSPDILYQDDSDGFKTREAWENQIKTFYPARGNPYPGIKTPEVVHQVKHNFGNWRGYASPTQLSVFLFISCNLNTAIAFAKGDNALIYLSNIDSNYAKFWERCPRAINCID